MSLPNIWGGGSTFAYSALDGENTAKKALISHLLSDRLGISFDTPLKGIMYVAINNCSDITFEIVASDIIKANITDNDGSVSALEFIFIKQNVILTRYSNKYILKFSFDENCVKKDTENGCVYMTNSEKFAVYTEDNGEYFISAIAYGDNAEKDAKESFTTEINKEISTKLDFFAKLPIMDNIPKNISNLASKCFSVLKSLIISPEENQKNAKIVSDRIYSKKSFSRDSVFSSFGLKYISPDITKQTLFSVLDTMNDDGSIPLFADTDEKSELCHAPCIAWSLLKLFEYTNDISCLSESFEKLKKYIHYYIDINDAEQKSLFEWKIKISDINCKCAESGMDNSPRFDNTTRAYSVDLACYIAKEAQSISKIADILSKPGEHLYWSVIFDRIKEAINRNLYDDQDKFYYDKDIATGEFIKVKTSSAFLPLFANICDKRQAEDIIEKHLFNKDEFFTPFLVPSTSLDTEQFDNDMWRGCVWVHINYMIAQGLLEYGYKKEAQKIINDTVMNILHWYENDGTIYEYYDASRKSSPSKLKRKSDAIFAYLPSVKAQPVRDFGMSCSLCAEMIVTSLRKED